MTLDKVIAILTKRGHKMDETALAKAPKHVEYDEVTRAGGPIQFKQRGRHLVIGVAVRSNRTELVISYGV